MIANLNLQMSKFRRAARSLFNNYYLDDDEQLSDSFSIVEKCLFNTLVLVYINAKGCEYGDVIDKISFSPVGQNAVMVDQSATSSGHRKVLYEEGMIFSFKQFSDVDFYNYRDYQFVIGVQRYPYDHSGRLVLFNFSEINFVDDDQKISTSI